MLSQLIGCRVDSATPYCGLRCDTEFQQPSSAKILPFYSNSHSGANCIDGLFLSNTPLCISQRAISPWIALDFGLGLVDVQKVVVYNRHNYGKRFRNAEVRVTASMPSSTSIMETEGRLIGNFAGPGTSGQVITFETEELKIGRYVLVQQKGSNDKDNKNHMNLLEVQVIGCKPDQGEQSSKIDPVDLPPRPWLPESDNQGV